MGALELDFIPSYTYEEYKNWEGKWEIINGVAYAMSPAPMIKHQSISAKIARYLDEALEGCEFCQALLPIDWKIDENTVVQPDNLVICHIPQNEAYIQQAPEIIFEVLSKSTASKDTHLKYEIYEREGVNYYITVNPDGEVAKIYRLKEGRYIKVCDTHDASVKFELEKCSIDFDFSKIW